jgi:hypothetical protein
MLFEKLSAVMHLVVFIVSDEKTLEVFNMKKWFIVTLRKLDDEVFWVLSRDYSGCV